MSQAAETVKTAYDLIAEGHPLPEKVTFRSFDESTAEDWAVIMLKSKERHGAVIELCLEHLNKLKDPSPAQLVDRYEHSLQTATRAWRGGAADDDEMIAAALLHDMGDYFAPFNHGEFAASVLKAFVRPEIYWLVKHHEVFQGYHFFHHLGGDRHARDQYRGHPYAQVTQDFCDNWDQTAFDPDYDTMPLEAFMPTLARVFAERKREVYTQVDED